MRSASPFRQASLPDGWVPFAFDLDGARQSVVHELKTARSVPATFRDTARLEALEAVWVPAWLLELRVTGAWQGERGDERPAMEGPATAGWDHHWSRQDGSLDETMVRLERALTGPGSPVFLSLQTPADLAALLRDEPGDDTAHLTPESSPDEVARRAIESAHHDASGLARERCGGARQREMRLDANVVITSSRQVWLPLYRGTYSWGIQRHALWVCADRTPPWVVLVTRPSDEAERALAAALDASRYAARSQGMNRGALILLAPLFLIVSMVMLAMAVSWLSGR